jgi:hypothetical protein
MRGFPSATSATSGRLPASQVSVNRVRVARVCAAASGRLRCANVRWRLAPLNARADLGEAGTSRASAVCLCRPRRGTGVRLPADAQIPRLFQPAFGSSIASSGRVRRSRASHRGRNECGFGRISWTSDLADIPAQYGGNNVYGDVGQLFATTLIAEPNVCAARCCRCRHVDQPVSR